MEILYLLVARGGSKGVPDKNLQRIEGLSLVGYKVRSALGSKSCDRVIVSTDSKAILDEAVSHGAIGPFLRPSELATDDASTSDVIAHALDWLRANEGKTYDAVMLLEPSSPFALPSDYDAAVQLMAEKEASSVLGIGPVGVATVFTGPLEQNGRLSAIAAKVMELSKVDRQSIAQEYTMNGALYLFRRDMFENTHSIYGDPENTYGHVMDSYQSIEIDEPIQLEWARFLAESGRINCSLWK